MNTEITGNGYIRIGTTFTISGNLATNASAITFPTATPYGYSVGYVSIWDGLGGGANYLFHNILTIPATIITNQQYQFAVNDLIIKIS